MSKQKEFVAGGLTKVAFSIDALQPLRELYQDIQSDKLMEGIDIGIKAHDDYGDKNFDGVSMRWYFAKSQKAINLFREVLDGCELAVVRDLVGDDRKKMRVVQGNIIEIIGSYPEGRWHSDMADSELSLNQSATLLTPLYPFEAHFGGLETTAASRESMDYDKNALVHQYRDGEAILFDGTGTIHRTQSYKAKPTEKRLLVSWQLADARKLMRPILQRIGEKNGDPMFFSSHKNKNI